MSKADSRFLAALSLGLIVAAANLGMVGRLYFQDYGGQAFFVATRVWILALPLVWVRGIDQRRLTLTWPSRPELRVGLLLGLTMFGVIYGAYALVGQSWINPADARARAATVGLLDPGMFLVFAVYFTFVNALVEEYIWRWFVYRKWEVLVSGVGAVMLAALCFTLHHIIALVGFTGDWVVAGLGAMGVFMAGAVWSWCYLTYRSLWACYISHLLADLAIAIVGWQLLFA